MKNKTWKFALICSLIVMGFTACDDDDEYYDETSGDFEEPDLEDFFN